MPPPGWTVTPRFGTYVHELAEGNIDGDARLDVLRYAEELTWIVPFSATFQARVG